MAVFGFLANHKILGSFWLDNKKHGLAAALESNNFKNIMYAIFYPDYILKLPC